LSLLERYQTMSAKLDAAIDSALEHEVAEVVKDIILEQAVSAVYSYPATAPAMSSRRKSDGGLGNRGNLSARVEAGHVLIVEDVAPLQGTDYGIALSDVVEHGLGNYRQPGPRPFLNRSETEAVSSGRAAAALLSGLARQGVTSSGFGVQKK
jgi:hypothetical protein